MTPNEWAKVPEEDKKQYLWRKLWERIDPLDQYVKWELEFTIPKTEEELQNDKEWKEGFDEWFDRERKQTRPSHKNRSEGPSNAPIDLHNAIKEN